MRFIAIGSFFLCAAGAVAAPALSIAEIINALGVGLVSDIHATITLESLTTNLISVNFDVKNPLPIELTVDSITSKAGLNGTEYAEFTFTFPKGLVVPPLGTKNSGTVPNVRLIQGATASLDIIPYGILDLQKTDAKIRAFTIFGTLGVPIPLDGLVQKNVPTTYDLDLS